jgi:hypothetical protein
MPASAIFHQKKFWQTRDSTRHITAIVEAQTSRQVNLLPHLKSASSSSFFRQQALDDRGFKSGKVDGSWGPGTEAAFKDFQKWATLSPTGEVDPISIAVLVARVIRTEGTVFSA